MRICIDIDGNVLNDEALPSGEFIAENDAPASSTRYEQAVYADFMSLVVVIDSSSKLVGYCSYFTFDEFPIDELHFCIDYIYLSKNLRNGELIEIIASLVTQNLAPSKNNFTSYSDSSSYINGGGSRFGQNICSRLGQMGLVECAL